MALSVHNDVLDAALDKIATATLQTLNTSVPASRAAAVSDALVSYTLTAGDGNGDYTIADGGSGGRKLTVAQQSGQNAGASGTATNISLSDATTLLYCSECTSQAITSSNPVTISTYDITIGDPTSV